MDLDKYIINLNNHADARRVVSANYPPWLLRDLHNFPYHMKAGSNSCFSFYSKYFDNSAYLDLCEVPPSEHLPVFLGNFRIWRDVSSGTTSSKSSCHPLNGSFAGILVFFKALTQLFCLRFTIEIFCHFLQLCDGQNSLAPSHRLSLFLSIIRKEEDTFMDIHKHLPKSVNTSRLWRDNREILAN